MNYLNFGKNIIIDFHGEYIGLKDIINSEIINVSSQGLNPLTPIVNENYYEIAIDLINSINIVDIYKLGITQESELIDSIISIKDKNLEELYEEINKRSKDEKTGHIRDALIGLKNRIRLLQSEFSLKTNIDFNKIIKQNSIIDLSGIANEDLKTLIRESRKYNLACILSSQLIYDFDPAIIRNAETKLFMMNDSEKDIDSIINITDVKY